MDPCADGNIRAGLTSLDLMHRFDPEDRLRASGSVEIIESAGVDAIECVWIQLLQLWLK